MSPSREAAEIEGSKTFAREFMVRHKVPSPRFELCGTLEEAEAFVARAPFGFPMVIKADGLAQGKGTVVAEDAATARKAVTAMMTDKKLGSAGQKLVMEEFLAGEEVSFLVFSDGSRVVPLASAQDHKRALDDDKGPMTGGMGTVSPATNMSLDLHKQVMKDIVLPTISGLAAEGRRFQGVLFVGLMVTESGPQGARVQRALRRPGDPGDPGPHALRHRPPPAAGGRGPAQGHQDRVGQGARGLRGPGRQGLSRRRRDRPGDPRPGGSREGEPTWSSTTPPPRARTGAS